LVTTAPAATMTLFPMVTPGRIVTLPPIQTSSPMVTGLAMPRCFLLPIGVIGWFTVLIIVFGPIMTWSPMRTGAMSRMMTL
jgi:hypothetical protein